MGIDILMYAERRTASGWELCGGLIPNHISFPEPVPEGLLVPAPIYSHRCRPLFAILADVGNPAWSAVPYEAISPPRGLPSDLSPALAEWTGRFHPDAASWLLLRELDEFPWHDRRIKKEAMVSKAAAHLFAGGDGSFPRTQWPEGEPCTYSRWKLDGVTVNWVETYAESAGDEFLVETMTYLKTLGPPEDVRIVFWFGW